MLKNRKSLAVSLLIFAVLGLFLLKNAPGLMAETTDNPAAVEQVVPVSAPTPPADASTENTPSDLSAPAALGAEVATQMQDRVLGSESAPVTIIEYASMTCSHCAHFATKILPEVKKRLIDTGKARLIFREFPLDGIALKASMMARCLPADKYFNIVEVVFGNQERWMTSKDPLESLAQLGSLAGMDKAAFDTCMANKGLETAILNVMQEGQGRYQIKSTPTFVFNNGAEKFAGAQDADKFEAIVNKLTQGK